MLRELQDGGGPGCEMRESAFSAQPAAAGEDMDNTWRPVEAEGKSGMTRMQMSSAILHPRWQPGAHPSTVAGPPPNASSCSEHQLGQLREGRGHAKGLMNHSATTAPTPDARLTSCSQNTMICRSSRAGGRQPKARGLVTESDEASPQVTCKDVRHASKGCIHPGSTLLWSPGT